MRWIMTIADQIKMLCARLNISVAELARRTDQSPQSLSAKLKRESFTIEELESIAEVTQTAFIRKFVLPNNEEV